MLTRELLLYRIREGRIRPSFVDARDRDLSVLAGRMLETAAQFVGLERGAIETALRATANAHPKPKIARGLAKLVIDRMDFGEPGEEAEALRTTTFLEASRIMRSLPDGAGFDRYQAALAEEMDLVAVRERLFTDLAEHRPLLSFKAISADALLDRYNLALAQGLLLYTDQVQIALEAPDLLEVRRTLRWLKFCRLVAWLEKSEERWLLTVEGPGALLSMQKKYGLQLASFLGAVPFLSRFRLTATVTLPRKSACTLELSEKDPLVSPHAGSPGHLPEEIAAFMDAFEDEEWSIDATPELRPVGVRDVAVPDFVLRHREGGEAIAVELFHRWHRGVLQRRLDALVLKPDPTLILGVDRALVDPALAKQVEESDQLFIFNAFPTKRALKKLLAKRLTPDGAAASPDRSARSPSDPSAS